MQFQDLLVHWYKVLYYQHRHCMHSLHEEKKVSGTLTAAAPSPSMAISNK